MDLDTADCPPFIPFTPFFIVYCGIVNAETSLRAVCTRPKLAIVGIRTAHCSVGRGLRRMMMNAEIRNCCDGKTGKEAEETIGTGYNILPFPTLCSLSGSPLEDTSPVVIGWQWIHPYSNTSYSMRPTGQ